MYDEIIISGFGGQGVLTLGEFVAMAGIIEGKNVTWVPTYGQEKRGGDANSAVVVSDEEVVSPIVENPTALLCMNEKSIFTFSDFIVPGGVMLYNSSMAAPAQVRGDIRVIAVPCNEIAVELGDERSANMVLLGAYLAYGKLVKKESVIAAMREKMGDRKEKLIAANILALERGAGLI